MAGVTVQMKANRQHSLEEIRKKISGIDEAVQVSKTEAAVSDVEIWTLAYEKYYIRVHSCAALIVVLTEHGQEQTACVIACAGGLGYGNYSIGANRDFAKSCVRVLESCGFHVTEEDWGMNAENAVDRFLQIFD